MSIGKRLAWFRAQAGKSQEELARICHISRKRISEIERGLGSPTVETLQSILKPLGTSLEVFFCGSTFVSDDPLENELAEKVRLILRDDTARPIAAWLLDAMYYHSLRELENIPVYAVAESRAAYRESSRHGKKGAPTP